MLTASADATTVPFSLTKMFAEGPLEYPQAMETLLSRFKCGNAGSVKTLARARPRKTSGMLCKETNKALVFAL